jgi:hypothetical protein
VKKACGPNPVDMKALLEGRTLNEKDQKKLDKMIESIESSVVQWKENVKKTTDLEFDIIVNPVRVQEHHKK